MPPVDSRIPPLLIGFNTCSSDQARGDYVLAHPFTIDLRFVQAIFGGPVKLAVAYLQAVAVAGGKVAATGDDTSVSFNPDRYPVGHGPIEAAWSAHESRSISLDVAIAQVRASAVTELLTFVYVKALCDHCDNESRNLQSDRAVPRMRLVIEAALALADARPPATDTDVWKTCFAAARSWLEICSVALSGVGDPRLLRHAASVGERMVATAAELGDTRHRQWLLERLGALFTDPYTAGRTFDVRQNYELSLRLWQDRLRDRLGAAFDTLADSDRHMPPVREALRRGERYLRQAIAIGEGKSKGTSIVVLLQGLLALQCLEEPIDLAEAASLARQALGLLPGPEQVERRIRLNTWLAGRFAVDNPADATAPAVADGDAGDETLPYLLQTPIADLLREHGTISLCDLVVQEVFALKAADRDADGLVLIARFRPLLFDPQTREERRIGIWRSEILMVRQVLSRSSGDGAAEVRQRRLAAHLEAAVRSVERDGEAEGLQELDAALELDRAAFAPHAEALASFRLTLTTGEGTNRFNRRQMVPALICYADAMVQAADLALPNAVLDCLDRLYDVADEGDDEALDLLIRVFEQTATQVELVTGEAGRVRLQAIYRRASRTWVTAGQAGVLEAETVFRTLRLAKGHWLASALNAPGGFDWRQDDEARRQLAAIDALAAELGGTEELGEAGALAERALIGKAGLHELRAGTDAEQRYENLRLAFDD